MLRKTLRVGSNLFHVVILGDTLLCLPFTFYCLLHAAIIIFSSLKRTVSFIFFLKRKLLSNLSFDFKIVDRFDAKPDTYWIDVCPNNGNLVAVIGHYKNVKILDKRESKVVKVILGCPSCKIHSILWTLILILVNYCVRWSPNGDMLATAGPCTETVKLFDFKTEKELDYKKKQTTSNFYF